MLTAVEAHYDGSRIVIDEDVPLANGQRLIVTILAPKSESSKAERNEAYMRKIREGFAQVRSGHGQIHDIVEIDDD